MRKFYMRSILTTLLIVLCSNLSISQNVNFVNLNFSDNEEINTENPKNNRSSIDVLVLTTNIDYGLCVEETIKHLKKHWRINYTVIVDVNTVEVETMLSYDVVWVTNNSQWSYNGIDGTLLSDKLGEFIDKGGKLLESACMMSDHPLWGLNGGAYVEEEKSPFTISTGELNFESNVVFNQPNHPILNNVSALTANYNENVKIRDNALLIASLDNGVPYIGVNSNVVAINEYIGNVYNSDKLKLMANSLIYLSGVDIPVVENLTVFGEDDNAKLIWQKPAIEEPDFFTESFEDTELPEG